MHQKVKDLYNSFREFQKLVHKCEATVLEVCRHPEAKASDLLAASQTYQKVWSQFQSIRLSTADALRKKGYSMLSDCVLTGSKR